VTTACRPAKSRTAARYQWARYLATVVEPAHTKDVFAARAGARLDLLSAAPWSAQSSRLRPYRSVGGEGAATVFVVRDGEWVRFVIRFEVLDVDRFREMASAMVAVSRDEPGTVVYDWYVDEAAGTGTLYEAYASAEALRAHGSGAVFTELAPGYADAVRVAQVDAFGAADGLPRRDVLGAPTTWWGAPIAAVAHAR
jgi:quinol monooxygenase YgiN